MDIEHILQDLKEEFTYGDIAERNKISLSQIYAITSCSEGLSLGKIQARLGNITGNMRSAEIKFIMSQEKG